MRKALSVLALFIISVIAPTLSLGESRPIADKSSSDLTVEAIELSPLQVDNLAQLGKVWGFLKYHHPMIIAGRLQWDKDLLRVLPEVLDAQDRKAGIAALIAWTSRLGEPDPCQPCAMLVGDVTQMRAQLQWIHNEEALGGKLSAYLMKVYKNRRANDEQFYVSQNPGPGNPQFLNESTYPELGHPDAGHRLLALYRFWNIIEYWSPYRYLIEEDWDDVLAEFVPRFFAAEAPGDYVLELMALLARVNDSHTNLWSSLAERPPRGSSLLPVSIRFVEGKAFVSKQLPGKASTDVLVPATSPILGGSGLRVGDVILEMDGTSVDALIEQWSAYYGASNESAKFRDIARTLTRSDAIQIDLKIERGGEVFDVTASRVPIELLDLTPNFRHDLAGDTFRLLSDEIAYLKLSSIDGENVAKYIEAAQGTKGLVIDIRNYPASFVVFALGKHLVPETTSFARFTRGDLSNPGAFYWTAPVAIEPADPYYEGRIVILVDEVSQSQAEYTAMALRAAPNAIVVGSTTAGADGNLSAIPFPGGHHTAISGIGVFYTDKTPTQRVGIVPNLDVHPTIAGLRAGRDEVLEVALGEILGPGISEDEIRNMAHIREIGMGE